MPRDMKPEVTLDAVVLTDLLCGACGNQLVVSIMPESDPMAGSWRADEYLLSCSISNCERFNVKYHAPMLPLIRYEAPT